jgi:predicted CoA-binding protein
MSTLETKVDDFLAQKRIAVAGVSRNEPNAAANVIYRKLRDVGYDVFPVNPYADEIEGTTCYHDLTSIPGGVDGVFIATPARATEELVHQCPEAGISRVWMHQSFHMAGTSVSDEAVKFCQEHNISVIAGACPLMFGKPSDGGHRFMRKVLGLFGGLPN